MKPNDNQNDLPDQLRDRMMDTMLRDKLTGRYPPKLLRNVERRLEAIGQRKQWMRVGVCFAACLLIGFFVYKLVFPPMSGVMDTVHVSALEAQRHDSGETSDLEFYDREPAAMQDASDPSMADDTSMSLRPSPQRPSYYRDDADNEFGGRGVDFKGLRESPLGDSRGPQSAVRGSGGMDGNPFGARKGARREKSMPRRGMPANPAIEERIAATRERERDPLASRIRAPHTAPADEKAPAASVSAPKSPDTVLRNPNSIVGIHDPAIVQTVEEDSLAPFDPKAGEGQGPGHGGDKYARIFDNPFRRVVDEALSTFSIDVDTAAYAKVRTHLIDFNRLPPADAVRIEELVNYFDYDYAAPRTGEPFAVHVETAACPWTAGHRLVRVALKGKEVDRKERPAGNFVFLLDVSGSMDDPRKLPLVREGMKLLVDQIEARDRVAIVVYAGASGMVLDSTPGSEKDRIKSAIDSLRPGGSTNGASGIQLAYQIAQSHFIKDGVNRVILCTDGDFNVGVTSTAELVRLVEDKAKSNVFLTALGFGVGNHNDAMMENIADKGNGVYGYIDTINEAKKLFVEQLNGTLMTIAKDVKIQIEFNPVHVAGYRLIGYENRILAKEDFNDDKKDAGEIGAGHTVTALYEIIPTNMKAAEKPPEKAADKPADKPADGDAKTAPMPPVVDDLEFQKPAALTDAAKASGQTLVVKLRYKQPEGDKSQLIKVGVTDDGKEFGRASNDFKFASSVASFGMLLRQSPYKGTATFAAVREIAAATKGEDKNGYRAEFLRMVESAATIAK